MAQEKLTRLLQAWSDGDAAALAELTPLVYNELRKLARFHMSHESAGHTLQATALLHESFLKLIDLRRMDWKNRKHFYGAASQIMRNVLVDHARKKRSVKRGGDVARVPIEEALSQSGASAALDVLAFDEALTHLAQIDRRKAQVVEFWFFGGMTVEEIADTLAIGTSTVNRDLAFAKVWLARELGSLPRHE